MLIFDRESLKIVRSKPLPSALLDQELSNATSHYILRPKRQEPRAFKSIMYLPAGWENMCIFRCIKKKKPFSKGLSLSICIARSNMGHWEKYGAQFHEGLMFFSDVFRPKKACIFLLGLHVFFWCQKYYKKHEAQAKKSEFFSPWSFMFWQFFGVIRFVIKKLAICVHLPTSES